MAYSFECRNCGKSILTFAKTNEEVNCASCSSTQLVPVTAVTADIDEVKKYIQSKDVKALRSRKGLRKEFRRISCPKCLKMYSGDYIPGFSFECERCGTLISLPMPSLVLECPEENPEIAYSLPSTTNASVDTHKSIVRESPREETKLKPRTKEELFLDDLSMLGLAWLNLLCYLAFYLPGLILNFVLISRARRIKAHLGAYPRGYKFLQFLSFIFFKIIFVILFLYAIGLWIYALSR